MVILCVDNLEFTNLKRKRSKIFVKKLRKIKSHIFNGGRYKITVRALRGDYGYCSNPKIKNKIIKISPHQDDRQLLATLIDESIHACFFDLDNYAVDEASDAIANFLWRVGYRLKN